MATKCSATAPCKECQKIIAGSAGCIPRSHTRKGLVRTAYSNAGNHSGVSHKWLAFVPATAENQKPQGARLHDGAMWDYEGDDTIVTTGYQTPMWIVFGRSPSRAKKHAKNLDTVLI